jgi:hypothetical protein
MIERRRRFLGRVLFADFKMSVLNGLAGARPSIVAALDRCKNKGEEKDL